MRILCSLSLQEFQMIGFSTTLVCIMVGYVQAVNSNFDVNLRNILRERNICRRICFSTAVVCLDAFTFLRTLYKIHNVYANYNSLDDKCQFWLDDNSRTLTSPYFDSMYQSVYYHNLNCTWLIKAQQGSYVNFEIDSLMVKNNTLLD